MRAVVSLVLTLHGLIHIIGFAKAFDLTRVRLFAHTISRPAGLLWLFCAVLFVAAAVLLLSRRGSWWLVAVPALVLSQGLVLTSWSDAKLGTVVNLFVLLLIIPAIAASLPGSFASTYNRAVQAELRRSAETPLLIEQDLENLPAPVQNYIRHVGAVGKPKVNNFHATFTGSMRRSQDGKWIDMTAEQYSFYDELARLFFMKASMFGIPFDGLHVFRGANATMKIRIAALFQIVDAKGPEMNQSETVTLFNDMCVLAPATLIDDHIRWEEIDGLTARARFTNQGVTITADLRFNETGELVGFVSNDRFLSADGKSYTNYPWSTPVSTYREFDGRRVATQGEAIWLTPEGEYSYARFTLTDVEYNCQSR